MGAETLWVTLPPLGWALWAAGGTWSKSFRRFVWPVVLAVFLSPHIGPWSALFLGVLVWGTASLGYGDSKNWFERTAVGCSYGFALWPIQVALWTPFVTGVWFIGHMALSRKYNDYPWKLVEGLVGGLQGLLAVWLVTH